MLGRSLTDSSCSAEPYSAEALPVKPLPSMARHYMYCPLSSSPLPALRLPQAHIHTQISAAHSRAHLDRTIDAFSRIGLELGVIKG